MTERELFKAISDLIGDRPDNSPSGKLVKTTTARSLSTPD